MRDDARVVGTIARGLRVPATGKHLGAVGAVVVPASSRVIHAARHVAVVWASGERRCGGAWLCRQLRSSRTIAAILPGWDGGSIGPQPTTLLPGLLFERGKPAVGRVADEVPGESCLDHLLAEIAPSDDDAGNGPAVAIAILDKSRRWLRERQDAQVLTRLLAECLASLGRIDAVEANGVGLPVRGDVERIAIGDMRHDPRELPATLSIDWRFALETRQRKQDGEKEHRAMTAILGHRPLARQRMNNRPGLLHPPRIAERAERSGRLAASCPEGGSPASQRAR